jgi:hypothetical protein
MPDRADVVPAVAELVGRDDRVARVDETGSARLDLHRVEDQLERSRATVSRVPAEEERRETIAKRRRSIELLDVEELSRWARWPGTVDLGGT